MKTPHDVIIQPVLSEKAYGRFSQGIYTSVSYTHLTLPTKA